MFSAALGESGPNQIAHCRESDAGQIDLFQGWLPCAVERWLSRALHFAVILTAGWPPGAKERSGRLVSERAVIRRVQPAFGCRHDLDAVGKRFEQATRLAGHRGGVDDGADAVEPAGARAALRHVEAVPKG